MTMKSGRRGFGQPAARVVEENAMAGIAPVDQAAQGATADVLDSSIQAWTQKSA